jgi:hypothetical protein
VDLSPVIAASAQWLVRSYPAADGAMNMALAQAQARQAATVAVWLRYPTALDAELVTFLGPGGSARLDRLTGADVHLSEDSDHTWRTWVDEVAVSWAACLLSTPFLAGAAVTALASSEHMTGPIGFGRLTDPGENDRRAVPLLRHPDLVAAVAGLHQPLLLERLQPGVVEG